MQLNLLPYPQHVTVLQDAYVSEPQTRKLCEDEALPKEGYRLRVSNDQIEIEFSNPAGLFYAEKTLAQLRQNDGTLPLVEIEDAPQFAWRGFMIDSSRHIQTVDEIKAFIDAAASFKCNVFHWHLCDDPGWRMECDTYPNLHTVGAWRDGWGFGNPNPERYGGFFSKDEIRDIVAFCAARHITVVPEFDIPGHSSAVIKSYPFLSCTEKDVDVTTEAGVFSNVLCAGKDETYWFCYAVLNDIMKLFPGEYIHIGGDEVPKDHWDACPACQAKIRCNKLKNSEELQGYFTARIASYLRQHGKTPIGWNEVLNADMLPHDVVAAKWHDREHRCDSFANSGGKIIMEETSHVYLDYDYKTTPLKQTYSYNLLPDTLSEAGKKNVLGVETPIWTEWVETFDRLCYMCFPRLLAVAEVGWTHPQTRDYADFKRRVEAQRAPLLAGGIKMAPAADWDPV